MLLFSCKEKSKLSGEASTRRIQVSCDKISCSVVIAQPSYEHSTKGKRLALNLKLAKLCVPAAAAAAAGYAIHTIPARGFSMCRGLIFGFTF